LEGLLEAVEKEVEGSNGEGLGILQYTKRVEQQPEYHGPQPESHSPW